MRDLTCEECGKEFVNESYRKYCCLTCKKAAKKTGRQRKGRAVKTKISPEVRLSRRLERMEQNMDDLIESNKLLMRNLHDMGEYIRQVPIATTQMILHNLRMVDEEEKDSNTEEE